MNVKVTIRDGYQPTSVVFNGRQISEVEHKKRTMLYGPPENDKNSKQNMKATRQQTNKNKKANIDLNSESYRQSQRQLLNELKRSNTQSKNNIENTQNTLLQKQNQIIEQNQRLLYEQMNNKNQNKPSVQNTEFKAIQKKLNQITGELDQIKKLNEEVVKLKQDFQKNKNSNQNTDHRPQQNLLQAQNNMKNMIQISQNNIEGLQNLQAIKSLQNFNIEGYNQAIFSLKKQIAQYQKQFQNIERELKIKSAKLQKLDVPPRFEEQLYKPYQQHLSNRIKNIDMHAIRDRLYQKIGIFDYGKFDNDISLIMAEAQSQFGKFKIICKEHEVVVPNNLIDAKELKNMDIKIPGVLEQYKRARGIVFEDPSKENKAGNINFGKDTQQSGTRMSKTNQIQQKLKKGNVHRKPQNLQRFVTKPIDLAHEVKLSKEEDRKQTTIFDNQQKKEKMEIKRNVKNSKEVNKDSDFEKYLENRARQQLELLYKQKRQRLQKMQRDLYQQSAEPIYLAPNINPQNVKNQQRKPIAKKQEIKQQQSQKYQQQYQQEEEQPKPKQIIKEKKNADPKQIGRQILKQKLKNLFAEKNPQSYSNIRNPYASTLEIKRNPQNQQRQVQNIAQGVINMINNTLNQVNQNLARSIQKKIENNQQRRPGSLQKRNPNSIQIPKLQPFRAPPVFNMALAPPNPNPVPYAFSHVAPIIPEKKIEVENYDQFKIKSSKIKKQEDQDYQFDDDEYKVSSDEQI